MCAWDTSPDTVDRFAADLTKAVQGAAPAREAAGEARSRGRR
jgi:hypothetical protein